MTGKEIKNAIEYWRKTAERDYDTMLGLFKIKRYPESLFFGHILLEKILKGLVVKIVNEQPPYIHDLVRLAELVKMDLSAEEFRFLKLVNGFNLKTRYPEDKLKIYKKYDKKNTQIVLDEVLVLHKKLCQKLK